MKNNDTADLTAPQPCEVSSRKKIFSIGLPKCNCRSERRFPLTPEGVEMLVERGFVVRMESNAAESIHYTDTAYSRHGALITTREETLLCDIVIHLAPLEVADIRKLRRGAMLLTLLHLECQNHDIVKELLNRSIIAIAIDLIADIHGNRPFADILSEISGRSSIAMASSLLADANHGKGILLGGVAGIIPCEVMIIGSGIAAVAAARSATGLGAMVRMFDNDVYSLRAAIRELGPQIIGSALHSGVVAKALASADVIVATDAVPQPVFDASAVSSMKKGVVVFDISGAEGGTFPSLPTINLAAACPDDTRIEAPRVCFIHAGSAVPRTAAMALSNTFITMLDDVVTLEGVTNALRLSPGLQGAAYTFMGKVVNASVARVAGMRHVDINLFLQLS